jgi:hypothetical protein
MLSFRQKLVSGIFAISFALAPLAAFADEQGHAIPWTDIAARDCSIVMNRVPIGAIILLRCKGKIDVVVDVIEERGK